MARKPPLPTWDPRLTVFTLVALLLVACAPAGPQREHPTAVQPVQVQAAEVPVGTLPATWTPAPETESPTSTPAGPGFQRRPTDTPRPIPTRTPYTPRPTMTLTPSVTPTPWRITEEEFVDQFGLENALSLSAFPGPAGDNGWGVHWIPTTSQPPGVVDRFVDEVVRMNMKWVVILNDGIHVGKNDYLVDRLVASGIMPIMRLYRSDTSLYDGDAGAVVRHYLPRGVYYYQLYNEPNVNIENRQGFANPNHYARVWAISARQVVAAGGYPGLGALSPGGAYNHYEFLNRTLQTLKANGDGDLLGRTWLSIHNYHGTRPLDDPDGFLLFRNYDAIIRAHLWRSMPMIGTEGGSYSTDPQVEKNLLIYQYNYMRNAEPYLFAFSHWLLANEAGGSFDPAWEWQALFRDGWVHPLVTDFLYVNDQ